MDRPTAIVLIDPYNDFLHQDGKLNPRIRDSLQKSDTIANLYKLLEFARKRKLPIFYCMHQQTSKYVMSDWKLMNKSLQGLKSNMVFQEGSWGVEFYDGMAPAPENGDVVVSKHWNSSSFQNTDLDFQLRQRGIGHVVMAGLVANTCLESTARYAYEHAYALTMLSDCTAGFSHEAKEMAEKLVWPLFSNEVVTVDKWIKSFGSEGGSVL